MASVGTNLADVKMGGADGVKGERGFAACCNMARGEDHLFHNLTEMFEPTAVQSILKQQSVGQMHHPQVMEGMGRVSFKRCGDCPWVKA